MNDEQIRKVIEDTYDASRDDTYRSMLRDFYSRKMLSTAVLVWGFGLVFCAGAVYSGVEFLRSDRGKWQVMYAALFICFVHGIGLMKIFAWEMIHRHSIKREIKRLELRIAELTETVKGQ